MTIQWGKGGEPSLLQPPGFLMPKTVQTSPKQSNEVKRKTVQISTASEVLVRKVQKVTALQCSVSVQCAVQCRVLVKCAVHCKDLVQGAVHIRVLVQCTVRSRVLVQCAVQYKVLVYCTVLYRGLVQCAMHIVILVKVFGSKGKQHYKRTASETQNHHQ